MKNTKKWIINKRKYEKNIKIIRLYKELKKLKIKKWPVKEVVGHPFYSYQITTIFQCILG